MELPNRSAAVMTQHPSDEDLFCPACQYNLRGIAGERCPECGLSIDRARLSVSRIPWVHRRTIGRWHGYWRTNLLAMLHPALLAEEMKRPVALSDAQRFRHVTVLIAVIPLAAWGDWFAQQQLRISIGSAPRFEVGWMLEYLAIATAAFSLWLFVLMVAGAGSYFFHPRRLPIVRQNRAIALSYYACAPLAWLFVPATFLLGILFSDADFGGFERKIVAWCAIMASATCGILVVWFWTVTIRMLRHTTGCGPARTIAFGVFLPCAWAALFLICWAITAAVVFASLVVLSLR